MSEFKECQNHFWSQNNQDGTGKCCIRCGLAENDLYPVEEIAAGHRIDKPSDSRELETIDEPVGSLQELHPEFAKVLHENFLELLGDDFPIENHISPNCQSKDV